MLFGQFAHDLPRDPDQRERAVEQDCRKGQVDGVEKDAATGEVDPFPCGGQGAGAV